MDYSIILSENKTMIQFDNQGYITPAEIIEIDFDFFEKTFVFNENRQLILQEYLIFLNELKTLNIGSFYQWINGSFTTLKSNPNDIDVVTFVHFEEYQKHNQYFRNKYLNRHLGKIDCYFLSSYPENDSNFPIFKANCLDFYHKFSKDIKLEKYLKSKNRSIFNKNFNKGFVKINF